MERRTEAEGCEVSVHVHPRRMQRPMRWFGVVKEGMDEGNMSGTSRGMEGNMKDRSSLRGNEEEEEPYEGYEGRQDGQHQGHEMAYGDDYHGPLRAGLGRWQRREPLRFLA